MTNALPISRLIETDINLSPAPAQMQNISTLLILGSSNVIDVVSRFRTYLSLDAVAADFGTSAPEYLAAALWFEQVPQPASLQIGRWAQTATNGYLFGATLTTAQQGMSGWDVLNNGAFEVAIDGVPYSITGLDFSAAANMNGVAAVIQAALVAAGAAGAACVWNSVYNRLSVESGTTGASSAVYFVNPPTASGSFTFAGQPANLDTITLNGTAVQFVTVPASGKVTIGGTLAVTLANLLTFLRTSTDVQILKFNYSVVGTVLYTVAATSGAGGNALTIAKSGANIAVSGATLTGGSGTDISVMTGLTLASSGSYVANGVAAETALAAVTLFDSNYGQGWYAATVLGAVDADHLAIAAYIEGTNTKHLYGVSTQEAGTISSVSTTDIAYQLSQLRYKRTATQYSSSNAYAVCSLLARILTVDYTGNATVITLMYKQEPGIVPETLNVSQITALESKNCNVFVAYNNSTAIIEPGVVASGDFLDIITGTDWLGLDIQTTLYNLLYTTTTKIPQTDAGNHILVTGMEAVCSQAVTNGLLAPGTWDAAGFGALNQGDFLPKGFYIYAPPVALQNPADRAARKSVAFQIAAKLAGAIHTVSVIINVNR